MSAAQLKAARLATKLRKERLDMAEAHLREGYSPRLVLEHLEAEAAFDAAPSQPGQPALKLSPAFGLMRCAELAFFAAAPPGTTGGGLPRLTDEQAIRRIKHAAGRLRSLAGR